MDLSGMDALILDSIRPKGTWGQSSGGDDSEEAWRVHFQISIRWSLVGEGWHLSPGAARGMAQLMTMYYGQM